MEMEPKNLATDRTAGHHAAVRMRVEAPLKAAPTISSNREIAIVQADCLALANDLEQAQALASTLEMELSGKTNELARFKLIWERTQGDLAKFEHDLDALRKERHALANEAQRAQAYEHKYQRAQAAHDELAKKVERLESELFREREAHMATKARVNALQQGTGSGDEPRLRQALEEMRTQIERALARSSGKPPIETPKAEHIEIEFST